MDICIRIKPEILNDVLHAVFKFNTKGKGHATHKHELKASMKHDNHGGHDDEYDHKHDEELNAKPDKVIYYFEAGVHSNNDPNLYTPESEWPKSMKYYLKYLR